MMIRKFVLVLMAVIGVNALQAAENNSEKLNGNNNKRSHPLGDFFSYYYQGIRAPNVGLLPKAVSLIALPMF